MKNQYILWNLSESGLHWGELEVFVPYIKFDLHISIT